MVVARVKGGAVAAPMPLGEADAAYAVRKITAADIRESLSQGWDDFLDRRGDLLFLGLVYPLVGLLAATLALGGALLPLLFPVAAGISLLGPVAAAGFYELARCRESGKECDWSHYFDVHKRPGWDGIVTVSCILLVIFLAWVLAAAALYVALFGTEPHSVGQFLTRLFTTSEGWTLIIAGNLVGAVFAGLVLMLSVVSMPMLVDKDVDARTAIATSVRAVLANKRMMLRWGLIVAALLIVGSIPLFIGLAVALPVLGYATWHLYTHMVIR